MILSEDILKQYNSARSLTDKTLPCHAPSLNLNFEQNGNVRACCYNVTHILGQWPQQTIEQIWNGTKAGELRGYISKNDFSAGCETCGRMIEAGNYQGVRARSYDEFAVTPLWTPVQFIKNKLSSQLPYPRVMEFELSNQCNLECVMCTGYFSSSIRKNREKLPAIHSPYNSEFVKQLEPFIPHLTDAKFLGGEPFMIDIYLEIWESILRLNPKMRIHITTNGTFLNNRIKQLLEGLRAGIILSIDSTVKETYNKIRINGNYEKVMENLDYFIAYSQRKKTFISMAACPIIYNWKELPQMLEFCISKNIVLYFNAVFHPVELSLREQPIPLLKEIITYLEPFCKKETHFGNFSGPYNWSVRAYNDYVKQLKGWLREREMIAEEEAKLAAIRGDDVTVLDEMSEEWSLIAINQTLTSLAGLVPKYYPNRIANLKNKLAHLLLQTPKGRLVEVFQCYLAVSSNGKEMPDDGLGEKFVIVAELLEQQPKRNEILKQMSAVAAADFIALIENRNVDELKRDMVIFFGG